MSEKKKLREQEIRESEKQLEEMGYKQELKRALPLSFLVFYGLAFVCLLTLFGTYGAISQASQGMIASSYVVSTVAMIFTAISYCFMSKAYPMSGSVYSYVGRSMNFHLGFMSGWTILLDYMLVPMINYMLAATYINVYFPDIPVWLIIIVLICIVSFINHMGIEVTAWTNNVIVVIEIVFIVAFLIAMVNYLSGGGGAGVILSSEGFLNNSFDWGQISIGGAAIFAGAAITMSNYSGFDAVTTMSEEANNSKNISKAVIITVILISVYFVVITYFMTLSWPNGWQEFRDVDNAAWELVVRVAGNGMGIFFVAAYVVATMASAIASQASAARILYSMGRDSILPKKVFGVVHAKRKTPTGGIIAIAIVSLCGIFVPLTLSFSLLSFGALIGFIMVNVSVIFHYYINEKKRGGVGLFKYIIIPIAGATICFISFLNLSTAAYIVGGCWVAAGFICLAISTNFFKKNPAKLEI